MQTRIQGDNYWENRPYADSHLDWKIGEKNWIKGYEMSLNHPHRQLILETLKGFDFESLLEVGCNAGPNLSVIQQRFPGVGLAGIDINHHAITSARLNPLLEKIRFSWENINNGLSFSNKSFDILLADAVLMYIKPEKIRQILKEFDRVTKKGIIIIDWYSFSFLGTIKNFHWARNYPRLLKELGFKGEKIKITHDLWPNQSWSKLGYIFIFHRV